MTDVTSWLVSSSVSIGPWQLGVSDVTDDITSDSELRLSAVLMMVNNVDVNLNRRSLMKKTGAVSGLDQQAAAERLSCCELKERST